MSRLIKHGIIIAFSMVFPLLLVATLALFGALAQGFYTWAIVFLVFMLALGVGTLKAID